ncbi:putative hexose transporter [Sesbania bispinosa]|nr:putative hexose transporter [Sesbania bispinosa]
MKKMMMLPWNTRVICFCDKVASTEAAPTKVVHVGGSQLACLEFLKSTERRAIGSLKMIGRFMGATYGDEVHHPYCYGWSFEYLWPYYYCYNWLANLSIAWLLVLLVMLMLGDTQHVVKIALKIVRSHVLRFFGRLSEYEHVGLVYWMDRVGSPGMTVRLWDLTELRDLKTHFRVGFATQITKNAFFLP